jgi:hypothetical protein|tara:strand:+ start:2942 stop:3133 length:192 start_codon:yes stop_codon:yes gene_type:complete
MVIVAVSVIKRGHHNHCLMEIHCSIITIVLVGFFLLMDFDNDKIRQTRENVEAVLAVHHSTFG